MAHKHSEGSPCECEKLKNAEREELREGLKKCTEAREADRRAREEENAKRAADAEAEVKGLKKKLVAFQLATAVGVAVLGQEAVSGIMARLDSVKAVQEKVTGGGVADLGAEPAAPPPADPLKVGIGGWRPVRPPFKPSKTEQTEKTDGDISGIFSGDYKSIPPDPLPPPTVTPPVVQPIDTRKALQNDTPPVIADALTVEPPFDPYAVFFTPSALPFDVYSTTLALGDNYGFGGYYGINTGGAVAPVVPSPAPFTVFAVGGLMHSRKRA